MSSEKMSVKRKYQTDNSTLHVFWLVT